MSFVASLIYAALVIISIGAIAAGVLSVFEPNSSFATDADSFNRWLETLSSDSSYTVTIDENEAFVLGYRQDCPESFERLDARCADDELCLCLQRAEGDQLDEVRCVGSYVGMSVEAQDPVKGESDGTDGGCAFSHDPGWLFNRERERAGIYIFTPDMDNNVITVSRTG